MYFEDPALTPPSFKENTKFYKENTKYKVQIFFSHLTVASSGLLLLLEISRTLRDI